MSVDRRMAGTGLVRRPSARGTAFLEFHIASLAAGPVLELWADRGITLSGGNVTAWADQSGNGNDLAEATAPPAWSASNAKFGGLPSVNAVAGSSEILKSTGASLIAAVAGNDKPFTWIVAAEILSSSGNQGGWARSDLENDGSLHVFQIAAADRWRATKVDDVGVSVTSNNPNTLSLASAAVGSIRHTGTAIQTYVNGSIDANTAHNVGTCTPDRFALFAKWDSSIGDYGTVEMYASFIWPRNLTDAEHTAVVNYLVARCGF